MSELPWCITQAKGMRERKVSDTEEEDAEIEGEEMEEGRPGQGS